MNKAIEVIKNHTSIRKFNDLKITLEEEQAIINSALRGATAGNMMLYSIIKIRDKKKLEKLSVSCDNQPFIKNADLGLLFLVDTNKFYKYFESRNIPNSFPDYTGSCSADFILGVQDCVIAAQNAVIAAESMDIGTCYIGDILENCEYHQKLFNLPNNVMPLSFVVFGRYDTKPSLRDRFDYNHVVFEETYPSIDETFINEMFKKSEETTENFAEKFYKRKINSEFFKELKRSVDIYLNFWH